MESVEDVPARGGGSASAHLFYTQGEPDYERAINQCQIS